MQNATYAPVYTKHGKNIAKLISIFISVEAILHGNDDELIAGELLKRIEEKRSAAG